MNSSPPTEPDPAARGGDGAAARRHRSRRLRRKLAGGMVVMTGLVGAGLAAAVLTPQAQLAVADVDHEALVREGQQLYETSCVTCHGSNLQGVPDHGPSLIGVGEAAVYFQVSTGRMPAAAPGAQIQSKPPKFDEHETDALGAFVASNGGGPSVVRDPDGHPAQGSLARGDVPRGGELFRLNCASCHNFTGRGGALSSGKFAPALGTANEQQIYGAMLTGPENMPRFSDAQLSPEEKHDIIAFIENRTKSNPEGGFGLGGFGPATEGLAIWTIGIIALVGTAMWIGSRS